MNIFRELISYEWRKVYKVFLLVVVSFSAYVIWDENPLSSMDYNAYYFGCFAGMGVAWSIFKDREQANVFLYTRPLSRLWLFWLEWLFGVVMLLALTVLPLMLIATGVRVSLYSESPFYPSLQWYDAQVLIPFLWAAFFYYQVTQILILYLNRFFTLGKDWVYGIGHLLFGIFCFYYAYLSFQFLYFSPNRASHFLVYGACVAACSLGTAFYFHTKTDIV